MEWTSRVRSQIIAVNVNLIKVRLIKSLYYTLYFKAKAKKLAKERNINMFRANNGWIDRWKTRNNIKFGKIYGE